MSIFDTLGGLLKDARAGNVAESEIHGAFDHLAGNVPAGSLAEGLAHAFNSDQTPPFPQMLSSLFGQSNPELKAGLLNQIVGAIGPSAAKQLATTAGLGAIAGAFSQGNLTPQQAMQVSPDQLHVLAQQAEKKNAGIVDMAAAFYAEHPALVKTIGAGALALLMTKISQRR